ncbi:MAG: hypothetical protein KatS3mg086_008 [Candidatus Dojkabacteria bacterium]|nr:MAG: hypothetical protein KatS3mg086_008 [Candidatus Dojkabacteria bacterium]
MANPNLNPQPSNSNDPLDMMNSGNQSLNNQNTNPQAQQNFVTPQPTGQNQNFQPNFSQPVAPPQAGSAQPVATPNPNFSKVNTNQNLINEQNFNTPPTPKSKKNEGSFLVRFFRLFVVFVFCILLGIVGAFVYINFFENENDSSLNTNDNQTETEDDSLSSDQVENNLLTITSAKSGDVVLGTFKVEGSKDMEIELEVLLTDEQESLLDTQTYDSKTNNWFVTLTLPEDTEANQGYIIVRNLNSLEELERIPVFFNENNTEFNPNLGTSTVGSFSLPKSGDVVSNPIIVTGQVSDFANKMILVRMVDQNENTIVEKSIFFENVTGQIPTFAEELEIDDEVSGSVFLILIEKDPITLQESILDEVEVQIEK